MPVWPWPSVDFFRVEDDEREKYHQSKAYDTKVEKAMKDMSNKDDELLTKKQERQMAWDKWYEKWEDYGLGAVYDKKHIAWKAAESQFQQARRPWGVV